MMAAVPVIFGGRTSRRPGRRADKAAGGRLWPLGLVAAAFVAAQLVFVSPRMGLGWDETVYVSQVSPHVPAAFFSAPRARGISLLAAPVALVTTSTVALRIYFAVLSGAGLFVALLPWRRLRPPGVLALAGALFAGLWITQFYGPQAMPNPWVAIGGLAAVGCFLRVAAASADPPAASEQAGPAAGPPPARTAVPVRESSSDPGAAPGRGDVAGAAGAAGPLLGLAGGLAFVALMRPGDAAWLAFPLLAAAALAGGRRRWPLLAAIAGGLVAGVAEWVVEAYASYGGVPARLHTASRVEGGLGWHVAIGDQLRALDGRTLCRPCDVAWRHPATSLWWIALPPLVVGGVGVALRAGRRLDAYLPALCALSVAVPYLFLIDYAAPRFLLPAYALLAVPVADLLAWPFTPPAGSMRPRPRAALIGLAAAGLAVHLGIQQVVLVRTVARTRADHADYARVAADLHRLGVRPPCLLAGDEAIPIAYYARCASAETGGNNADTTTAGIVGAMARKAVAVLTARGSGPPAYARGWSARPLPGLTDLRGYRAYLPPRRRARAPGSSRGPRRADRLRTGGSR